MDFANIKDQISKIKSEIQLLNPDDIQDTEPYMDVIEFNKMVDSVKAKLQQSSNESTFFKNVFNTQDYYQNISTYLEQTQMSIEHKIKKGGVSPDSNKRLQQSLKMIQDIIDILVIEYGNSTKNDKKRWIKRDIGFRKEIKNTLSELVALKDQIKKLIKMDSKIVSNVILKEFKTIFVFFSNCIKVAKKHNDELLLVEIAGISDKILAMIQPVFGVKSLNINELIYYYLFYEIRELKASAIGQKLA
ncbi:hypothetical protein [Campylobacter mucosalis]|uniref:Uncharacterized protein n=1 Tax=Campylobacter mucosalis CCUG 21559 TaxID=1032067 RepID=A0A6G5QHI4_9BACT|nr:hypothetical protein [Campylobacter mucosalis]QCD45121.1 hypothetical protein CMUC_1357 [Campylobacter mucosalis CCUG 21559]